ncbi:MAG: AgmX/PglI C-terminal domain-containing protein [Deltaproteobacteria bacterium]|nr:AgmX/PglI C-terminal domain-containing protein [Deltaproteobacteria bacterium]
MEGKQKLALTFAFYQGDQLVRRETVSQDIMKVGKDPKSHLRVDDELAGRMHAVIEVQDDVTLIDLGSESGTVVNGTRVNKCKLNQGDQLQIGATLIVLERVEASAAEAAPVPSAAVGAPAPQASNPFAAPPAALASNPFGGVAAPPLSNPFAAAPAATVPNPFASNPFAAPVPSHAGHGGHGHGRDPFANAREGSYEYQLMKGGAPVRSDEVEGAASAVEIRVLWGRNLLHVSHIPTNRSFSVGEAEGKNLKVDYSLPAEKLGASRLTLVDGGAVVVPPGATGWVESGPNQPKVPIQQAAQGGRVNVNNGTAVHLEVQDLVFEINGVASGRKVVAAATLAAFITGSAILYVLGAGVGIGGFLAATAMFTPDLNATSADEVNDEQRYLISHYLDAAAEKELEDKPAEEVSESNADNKEGGTGTRAKGEEGSMGNPNSKQSGNRYGVAGPENNPDPHIARQAALRDAAEFGMIGLLNSGAGGDPDAPTAPWGRDDSLGSDPLSARGNMWGDAIGESFGAGGLGLTGIGEGGGGRGEGIGLGSIGTLGHGAGTGTGQGFGSGHGRLSGSHRAKPPSVRMGSTSVSGRLPPEVIQRIVRQNFGRFRMCYENGLRNNPNLQGTVSVSFVIGRDGGVSNVGGGGGLPDSGVTSCVTRAFYGLAFPAPEGGVVRVTYPISFSPG